MTTYLKSIDQQGKMIFIFYLLGVLHWYLFMTWGELDYTAFDWKYIHQWLAVMKLALEAGQIPYHVAYYLEEIATGQWVFDSRYFALPFLIASPQILALSFLGISDWMTLQLILIYTVGFWGLVKWIRKLELSVSASVFVILLFNFNGFHSSRIGVGHLQNTGYFLVPWLLWIVNNFIVSRFSGFKHNLLISLQLAFFLFFTLLQGSMLLIQNMFLVGLCILAFYPKQIPWYLLGAAIGLILSSYIVWPVLLFSPYASSTSREVASGYGVKYHGAFSYIAGAMYRLWDGLTGLYTARADAWEYDAYIGLFGVVLLLVGGTGVLMRKTPLGPSSPLLSKGFTVGMSVVLLLSLDSVYKNIWSLLLLVYPLPAIDRFPSRLIIYPLTYVILVASLGFDQAFEIVRREKVRSILKWLSLLILFILLMQHSLLWSFSNTALEWFGNPDSLEQKLTFGARILNHGGDDLYITTVNVSYFVSLITGISAAVGYIYLRRRVFQPS